MAEQQLLIVGAGPTGLVLAIELARRSVPLRIIDRRDEPMAEDRAVIISPSTLEACRRMGVVDQVLEGSARTREVRFFWNGHLLTWLPVGSGHRYPFNANMPEGRFCAILERRLNDLGVGVEWSCALSELEAGPERVAARLDGAGSSSEADVGWLVGCDGAHSTVRAGVGIAFDGHDLPFEWHVLDAPLIERGFPDESDAIWLDEGWVAAVNLPEDLYRIYFRTRSHLDDPEAWLREYLDSRAAPVPGRLGATTQMASYWTHSRVAARFRSGRILLAGDAAHAISPIEGRGMNAGVQDALNLGWKLANVVDAGADEVLLDTFEAERRPVARAVAQSADAAEMLGADDDVPARRRALRTFAMRVSGLQRTTHLERDASIEAGVYEPNELVEKHDTPCDLAPGSRLGTGLAVIDGEGAEVMLMDLLDATSPSIVAWISDCAPDEIHESSSMGSPMVVVGRQAVAFPGATCVADPELGAHDLVGVADLAVMVIRPDGVVGLRHDAPGIDWSQIADYLRRA